MAIVELTKESSADAFGIFLVGIIVSGHPAITAKGTRIPSPNPFPLTGRIFYILSIETKTGRTNEFTASAVGASLTQFLP